MRAITDVVMDRINDLLNPEYRYAQELRSDDVRGVERLV